jgi:hypothetical protein
MAKTRNGHKSLVVKPEDKISLGRNSLSWENNIKMLFYKNRMWLCGPDSSGSI